MLLQMHRNAVFPLVNMEMEAFEKHYRLRKMEMEVFVKTPVISTIPYNFIKGNKILQPNILIYFNTNFNVIQRTIIVMGGGDGGF